jgi:effector-binding domain-containing protein
MRAGRGADSVMSGTAARVLALLALAASASFAAEPSPSPSATPATTTPAPATPAPATPTPTPPAVSTPTPSPSPNDSGSVGALVELTSHPALYIEAKASREEVYEAILANLAKLRDAAAKAGLKPQGPALAVFLSADDDGFTYRAMVPLESAPDPKLALPDPIKSGQTPVGKAMKFEHRGEYDDIDSTYEAITAYLDEKGVDAQDVFVEQYLNEPKTSDDPNGQVDIYVLTR